MSAEAWVGIALSQPDGLNGLIRVMRLMLHYGWTGAAISKTKNSCEQENQ